jgi:hypothetical protein
MRDGVPRSEDIYGSGSDEAIEYSGFGRCADGLDWSDGLRVNEPGRQQNQRRLTVA